MTASRVTWTNWAANQEASCGTAHPRGTDEIAALVNRAAAEGRRVKPIGAGHSFTAIGRPEGLQIVLDRHADLIRLDTASGLVTVQAGMSLRRLNRVLAEAGLGMTNLGDIEEQTVAGALSTGTHGTGARFTGLAAQLRGLELVLADGRVVTCSATENPEIFGPARISLGALGIISTLTLQAEPAFALRAEEYSMPLAEMLDGFHEITEQADHFEFYWFPHTTSVLAKRNTRLPLEAGVTPLSPLRAWWDDEFMSNTVFGATIALGRRAPGLIPQVNRLSARALGARTYTDRSHRVFTSTRRIRFTEMEYAVPRAAAVPALQAVQRVIENSDRPIAFPLEIRVTAADDIPLSTSVGRDSAYIAVHSPAGVDARAYFDAVEAAMVDHEGRPHWGKLHNLDSGRLRQLYPAFDDFVDLRDRLDPAGTFTNAYLDRVLGPVGEQRW